MSKSGNLFSAVSEYWRSILFALYLHKVTDSFWRSWCLANFRGKPFLTVVLSAMDHKIDRAYGDQTPKVSHSYKRDKMSSIIIHNVLVLSVLSYLTNSSGHPSLRRSRNLVHLKGALRWTSVPTLVGIR